MASLPPGTPIGGGRYTVVRELNRGGTAVVYEGLDAATGAMVALKVMSARDGRMSVSMKGVRREIEYASSVRCWGGRRLGLRVICGVASRRASRAPLCAPAERRHLCASNRPRGF
jgi:hypothetical protein